MAKQVVFEGTILNHGIEELHPNFPYSDGHFRVVLTCQRIIGESMDVHEFFVEREGFRDAMNDPTWVLVKGDGRQKILAQVAVILGAKQTKLIDVLSARTPVTVPGDAVGEPPKS